jgi:hypothetical protein
MNQQELQTKGEIEAAKIKSAHALKDMELENERQIESSKMDAKWQLELKIVEMKIAAEMVLEEFKAKTQIVLANIAQEEGEEKAMTELFGDKEGGPGSYLNPIHTLMSGMSELMEQMREERKSEGPGTEKVIERLGEGMYKMTVVK